MNGALLRCGSLAALVLLLGCSSVPPVEPAAGKPLPAEPGVEKEMIVILGASYAAGWNPTDSDGLQFINKGEGGQQSFEMLNRFDRDVLENKPRAVILWGYINDIFRSNRESVEATKARARESFLEMIRRALENDVEPILATEVTIRPKAGIKEAVAGFFGGILGKESYQSYINKHVMELNVWLRAEAESRNLQLLDFESALRGSDGYRLKKFAKDDGSHIPPAGYAALDAYAGPILREKYAGGGNRPSSR